MSSCTTYVYVDHAVQLGRACVGPMHRYTIVVCYSILFPLQRRQQLQIDAHAEKVLLHWTDISTTMMTPTGIGQNLTSHSQMPKVMSWSFH